MTDDSPDPRAAARQLRAMGMRPSRRLSQSFLCAPDIAAAMVRAGGVGPDDVVLEVGPGLGILTRELVRVAARVVSIELDPRLADALPASLGFPGNLRVVQGDAARIDLSGLVSEPYLVVASLPYHVASPLLFRLALQAPRPERIVVMLQEEVAQRVVGRLGAMTFLGAALQAVLTARLVRRVGPGAFFPVPKVRSAVVRLDRRAAPEVPLDRLDGFVEFLRSGFAQPRQQLHNSMSRGLEVPTNDVRRVLEAMGVAVIRRPAELALVEWAALYERVGELGWLRRNGE